MAKKKVVKKVAKRKKKPVINAIFDKIDQFMEENVIYLPQSKRDAYRATARALFMDAIKAGVKGGLEYAEGRTGGKVPL